MDTAQPLITVITVTRNNARGLARTLASVAAQTYPHIQHIVVDGYSTDDTASLLASARATVVQRPPRGVYDAINHGLQLATGRIVGLLHADDVFSDPAILQHVANAFSAGDTDYVYADVHFTDSTGRTVRRYSGKPDGSRFFQPPHPTLYMTARAVRTVGPYDTTFRVAADIDMLLRIQRLGLRGRYLPLDMVDMAAGGLSGTWVNRIFVNQPERLRAYRKNGVRVSVMGLLRHYIEALCPR